MARRNRIDVGKVATDGVQHLIQPAPVGVIPEKVKCPFTGETLKCERNELVGKWRIVGPFYATKWYESRRAMVYDFMTRNGVAPKEFKREIEVQVVRDETDPAAGEVADVNQGLNYQPDGDMIDRVAAGQPAAVA